MNLKSALDQVLSMVHNFQQRSREIEAQRSRIDKLQAIVERHQRSIKVIRSTIVDLSSDRDQVHPLLQNRYLQPIADAALAGFPGMAVEIHGPFGLASTSSMTICDPKVDGPERELFYLNFRLDLKTGAVCYLDESQAVERYPAESIGAINGLNSVATPLAADMDVEQLVKLFKACETACAA